MGVSPPSGSAAAASLPSRRGRDRRDLSAAIGIAKHGSATQCASDPAGVQHVLDGVCSYAPILVEDCVSSRRTASICIQRCRPTRSSVRIALHRKRALAAKTWPRRKPGNRRPAANVRTSDTPAAEMCSANARAAEMATADAGTTEMAPANVGATEMHSAAAEVPTAAEMAAASAASSRRRASNARQDRR
jgi:hypothetical protein